MAIAPTTLTSGGSTTLGQTCTTASYTPTANRLVLLAVYSTQNVTPKASVVHTATGNGLTWVRVGGAKCWTTDSGSTYWGHLSLFRAMGTSPTSGSITVTVPGTDPADFFAWSVVEFSGVDTTGTNGSGAIVQFGANTPPAMGAQDVTAINAPLAAFSSVDNATYGAFAASEASGAARTFTPGNFFNEMHDNGVSYAQVMTEWKPANDTTVDATASGVSYLCGLAVELKQATGTGVSPSVTSVTGTGTLGSVTTSGKAGYTATGTAATGAVGSVTTSGNAGYTTTGVAGTGAVGTVTPSIGGSTAVTAVTGTGTLGTVTPSGKANYTTTGVASTSGLGSIDTLVNINATVTGTAMTGAVGTVSADVAGLDEAFLVGLEAIPAIGTLTVTGQASVPLTGVVGTTELGAHTSGSPVNITQSGLLAAEGQIGFTTVSGAGNLTLTGVTGTGTLGTATKRDSLSVPVTGVTGTGTLGNEGIQHNGQTDVLTATATGEIGNVVVTHKGSVAVTGVAAASGLGAVVQGTVAIPFRAKVGSFVPRSTAGSQSITGLGFTPKVVEMWVMENGTTVDGNHLRYCYGGSDGTSQFVAVAGYGYAISNSWNQFFTDRSVHIVDADTEATVLSASLTSLDGDGFTINVTTAAAGKTVYFEAIGGSGFTVKVGTFNTLASSSGAQAVTGVGFKPKAIQFVSGPKRTDAVAQSDAELMIGFATASARVAMNFYAQEINGTTRAASGLVTDAALMGVNPTASPVNYAYKGTLTSMDADGFTLNWTSSPFYATRTGYIAYAGAAQFAIGSFDSSISTGLQSITGIGFTPSEATFLGQGYTPPSGYRLNAVNCLGVATASNQVAAGSFFLPDNITAAAGVNFPYTSVNGAYALNTVSTTGNGMSTANMAYASSDPNGFTVQWVTNDGTAKKIGYFVSGFTTAQLSGVQATGAVGTVTATGKASVTLTGIAATSGLGNEVVTVPRTVAITNFTATGAVGSVSVAAKAQVTLTGVTATSLLGTFDYAGSFVGITLTGMAATSALGSVGMFSDVHLTANGLQASATLGSGYLITGQVQSVTAVTGVEASGVVDYAPIVHHNCHVAADSVVANTALQSRLVVYASQFGIMQALPGQWSSSVGGNTSEWDDVDSPSTGGWKRIPPA